MLQYDYYTINFKNWYKCLSHAGKFHTVELMNDDPKNFVETEEKSYPQIEKVLFKKLTKEVVSCQGNK